MITELRQPIPIKSTKGEAVAYFLIEGAFDHNVVWGVCVDATGEWWWLDNTLVRGYPNPTYIAKRESDL
jgi:hypothetical protein